MSNQAVSHQTSASWMGKGKPGPRFIANNGWAIPLQLHRDGCECDRKNLQTGISADLEFFSTGGLISEPVEAFDR